MFSRKARDYPIDPTPRWGHGKPAHGAIGDVLGSGRQTYKDVLGAMAQFKPLLHAIPGSDPSCSGTPQWDNDWFSTLDAASLVCFLLQRRPARYIEIGSGFSTMFARHAVTVGALPTTITSIDPTPRAAIDKLCDSILRTPLEACDLSIFDALAAGDILFFDGSHRVLQNSDVTIFFLEVLPRLPPGILIHIHDIFLPHDYPHNWTKRLYSEQYMLAAMLLCDRRQFTVLLPNYFIFTEPELQAQVEEIFASETAGQGISVFYRNSRIPGVSFWIETVKQSL